MKTTQMKSNTRLALEAWTHLASTQKKSVDEDGHCQYRGSGCAFTPALKPDTLLEAGNFTACYLISREPRLLKGWALYCSPVFAESVQEAHDTFSGPPVSFLHYFACQLRSACNSCDVPIPQGCLDYLKQHGEEYDS